MHVDGERIAADTIVGADGVNGVTARAVGRDHGVGVALEGNLPYTKCDRGEYAGKLVLELGVVPGGYGWVFPKGDHVNFGVGGWEAEGPRLREHLQRLCDAHGVRADDLTDVRGYRLPFRRVRLAARGATTCCSSATRQGSSTRCRATGCTRHS